MRQPHIDFVHRPRWLFVWLPAVLVVSLAVGVVAARQHKLDGSVRSMQKRTELLLPQLRKAEPNEDQKRAAAQLDLQRRSMERVLKQDWNPAFATVENVREPGTKLISLTLDAESQAVRLDYEVASMAQALALDRAMNEGTDRPTWKFEGVSARQRGEPMNAAWRARLEELR